MTRHKNARGKQLPSLSQRGFNHIPHNPMQRVPEEGGGKKPGRVLDAFNDRQEERTLHPTNGWRKLSVKRSRAQMLVAAIRNGQRMDTASMANFLRFGSFTSGARENVGAAIFQKP
jgi:hypothetical protein